MNISSKIRPYTASDYRAFEDMFDACFADDYKIDLTREQLEEICAGITQQIEAGILFVDLLTQEGVAKGFIIYQIDSPQSDWCEKEGFGFIREIFIAPDLRNKKHGKDLVVHAESRFKALQVPNIYLTSAEESTGFWAKMGYQDSGEICDRNHDRIFIK